MNKVSRFFIPLSLSLLFFIACGKQGNASRSGEQLAVDSDSIPTEVKNLIRAVQTGDRKEFADMVTYPLERPYPLHDIEDASGMEAYYPVLVDDSLKNVITGSSASDWEEMGWRGWTLNSGTLWMEEGLYAVNNLSHRERQMLDSLLRRDKETLPASMRDGWKPENCFVSDNGAYVYRLDLATAPTSDDDEDECRLSIFKSPVRAGSRPFKVLVGSKEVEGSGSYTHYSFEDGDGTDIELWPYPMSSDDESAYILYQKDDEDTGRKEWIRKGYWLDMIN